MGVRSLALSALFFLGCAHSPRLVPEGGFRHELGREHPLSGRIWATGERKFISPEQLLSHVRASTWLVLGETHDNADHHILQAHLLAAFLSTHPNASVSFEMLDETQRPLLVPPLPDDPDELARRVGWEATGWPAFALYRPVFAVALGQGARIVAAHPRREHVVSAMHGVPEEWAESLALSPPLTPEAERTLANEIRESHCGAAPEAMVEGMLRAQSFKDAWMARSMIDGGAPGVLIAGRGHARKTYGVPLFLERRGAREVTTVALIEVDDAREHPEQYDVAGYDFALFTPRTTNESACDRFRAQLERMRKQGGSP